MACISLFIISGFYPCLVGQGQGAVIYLMTPTPPPGNPDAKSDVFDFAKPRHFRWNELWTSDQDAATSLYGDVFGWTQEGAMPMGVEWCSATWISSAAFRMP